MIEKAASFLHQERMETHHMLRSLMMERQQKVEGTVDGTAAFSPLNNQIDPEYMNVFYGG